MMGVVSHNEMYILSMYLFYPPLGHIVIRLYLFESRLHRII